MRYLILCCFGLIASNLVTTLGHAKNCADDYAQIIGYRCDRPGHASDGKFFCCDYVNIDPRTRTAGAVTSCQKSCIHLGKGRCVEVTGEGLSVEFKKKYGQQLPYIGLDAVSAYETTIPKDAIFEVEVPDPQDQSGDRLITKRKVVKVRTGTIFGDTTFLGSLSRRGAVHVKRCHPLLNTTVIQVMSHPNFYNRLAEMAHTDPALREMLNNLPAIN